MAKVSIIIPCYNAVKYINTCFESLERQTIGMENLEVILVNDASTDHTLELLCEFEKKYPQNVMLINCARNGRQGAARNIGLSYATAEYIGFADDDDAFEPEMLEMMWEKARAYRCDMVMCDFDQLTDADVQAYQQGGKQEKHREADEGGGQDELYEITTVEERVAFITMDPVRCVWNKLYRREMLTEHHILFPEGYIYDDIYFYELVKQYAGRVYKINRVWYHHILRKESASTDTKRGKDMMGYLDVQLMLLEELKRRGLYEPYRDSYHEMLMLEAIGLIKTYIIRYGKIEDTVLTEIKEKLCPYKKEFMENSLLQPLWSMGTDNEDKRIARMILS